MTRQRYWFGWFIVGSAYVWGSMDEQFAYPFWVGAGISAAHFFAFACAFRPLVKTKGVTS